MSCPKTQQWGTWALSRLSARALPIATFIFGCLSCAFLVTAALLEVKRANFYSYKMKNMFQT